MALNEYDPDLVDVVVDVATMSGFQEDSICEFEYDDEFYEIVKGVDGDVSRSRKVCRTGKLTIHLLNTSKSNAVLTALMSFGFTSGNGTADVFTVLIRDRNGASLVSCEKCWIQKAPGIAHADKAQPRDWVIALEKPILVETGV
jgi:hypothetical protein